MKLTLRRTRSERGVTLVEVVVVGVLASIVMLALTGFYINSQGTWIDASSQALTQREVSFALETIADSVHTANSGTIGTSPPSLILYNYGTPPTEKCTFLIDPGDSLLHETIGGVDRGPLSSSVVTKFDVSCDASIARVLALEMRSANGRMILMSTGAAFYNK